VEQIRARWPEVRVILRDDSGFCRDELQPNVRYVFGRARNERLRKIIGPQLAPAAGLYRQILRPARVFTEFTHIATTGSWSRARRVVAMAYIRCSPDCVGWA
jgi:hypothetical protein